MHRSVVIILVSSLLIGGLVAGPVSAANTSEEFDEPMIYVDVSADGDATVSLVSVYEFEDDDEHEQSAFESLEEDEEAQAEFRDRFGERMESVADSTGQDGESVIGGESISIQTTDEYGVVTVAVEWDDFAEVDGEDLIVTEPFASGFETEQTLVIAGPDNSSIKSISHEPVSEEQTQASWEGGTDFDGFELVFSVDDDSSTGNSSESDDQVPGFSLIPGIVAVIAALGILVISLNYWELRED